MNDTQYWVHDLSPFLIEFWDGFGIRYYGLAYVLGFVAGIWLLNQFYKYGKSPLNPKQQETLTIGIIFGVILGGRLGFVFLYDLGEFVSRPWMVFEFWKGGMASHGGFIGVMIAIWWCARKFNLSFLRLGDLICPLIPPGLLFGRIANFINGELWGTKTDVSWAVIFPDSAPPGTPVELIAPRHPSQLYEAALEGAILLAYTQWRFWKTDAVRYPGRMGGEFLFLYAIARIVCEFFREPDAGLILGMSRGMFYSIFLAVAGIGLILYSYQKPPDELEPDESSSSSRLT